MNKVVGVVYYNDGTAAYIITKGREEVDFLQLSLSERDPCKPAISSVKD